MQTIKIIVKGEKQGKLNSIFYVNSEIQLHIYEKSTTTLHDLLFIICCPCNSTIICRADKADI